MRWLAYIGLTLVLAACGKGLTSPAVDHGVFEPYFQRFETYSEEQGRDTTGDAAIPISFGGSDQDLGECQWGILGEGVYVNYDHWQRANDAEKEVLILHELGHCLLNRVHTDDTGSIMYPDTDDIATGYNSDTKQSYIEELFHW